MPNKLKSHRGARISVAKWERPMPLEFMEKSLDTLFQDPCCAVMR